MVTPQTWRPAGFVLKLLNLKSPEITRGDRSSLIDPLPNWPTSLLPQHIARRSFPRAQVKLVLA